MTDRELLEAAAEAADLLFDPTVKIKHGLLVARADEGCQSRTVLWNPLTDDGDALRLAVKLNLGISIPVHQTIRADVVCFRDSSVNVREEGNDPYAATRRAIVRAAAEIGGKE